MSLSGPRTPTLGHVETQSTEHLSLDYQDPISSPAPIAANGAGTLTTLVPQRPSEAAVAAEPVEATRPVWRFFKRALDVLLSVSLLTAALPLLIVIAVAIKLDSPGPIFFRVRRVGHNGRPLMMLKFRKMHDDASGGPLTTGDDPRLTYVGKFLTHARLDELPQLWDVLRGRMSIVGPRPEDPAFVALHPEDYAQILTVRPGITGLSQMAYAGEHDILDADSPVDDYVGRILPQKLDMDKLYARRSSLRLDAAVLYWTVITVIMRRPVAVHRHTAKMNIRRRRTPRAVPAADPQPGAPNPVVASSGSVAAAAVAAPVAASPAPPPARQSVA
jgi:lipopolysaccharide/colanic/teichoic acid biosynthesis glycosyltransferase